MLSHLSSSLSLYHNHVTSEFKMFHAKKKYCVNIYSPVTKIFNFFILNVNARYNNDTVGLENFAEKEQQIFNFILS